METKNVSEKLKNGEEEHTSKNNCIGNKKKSKKKNKTKLNNNKFDENVESTVIKSETTVEELNIQLEERLHIKPKAVNGLVNGDDLKNGEDFSANKEQNDVVRICKTENGLCISSKFVGEEISEKLESPEICKTKHKQNDNAQINCSNQNLIVDDISIEYKEYQSELQMPDIMRLIQKDLSEPYSIYTYRYFIHNWPKLCFLAMHNNLCVGAIVCKLDVHRQTVRRGYIAMLAVDKDFRKLKIGTNLVQKAIQVSFILIWIHFKSLI